MESNKPRGDYVYVQQATMLMLRTVAKTMCDVVKTEHNIDISVDHLLGQLGVIEPTAYSDSSKKRTSKRKVIVPDPNGCTYVYKAGARRKGEACGGPVKVIITTPSGDIHRFCTQHIKCKDPAALAKEEGNTIENIEPANGKQTKKSTTPKSRSASKSKSQSNGSEDIDVVDASGLKSVIKNDPEESSADLEEM